MPPEIFADVTVVVPTWNRPNALNRQLRWLERMRSVSVIIVDGSESPSSEEWSKYDAINIQYLWIRDTFPARIARAAANIQTDFVVLAADDDIILPSAIQNAASFLNSQPEAVSAGWQCVLFGFVGDKLWSQSTYETLQKQNCHPDFPERIRHLLKAYVPRTVYALSRSREWRTSVELASSRRLDFFASFELIFELAMAIQGPNYSLEEFGWFRSTEQVSTWGSEPNLDPQNQFKSWLSVHQNRLWLESSLTQLLSSDIQAAPEPAWILSALDEFAQSRYSGRARAALEHSLSFFRSRVGTNSWGRFGKFLPRLERQEISSLREQVPMPEEVRAFLTTNRLEGGQGCISDTRMPNEG